MEYRITTTENKCTSVFFSQEPAKEYMAQLVDQGISFTFTLETK